ncbi:hypothetical protein SGO26_29360 (plasmid) [Cupriavidus metallidurans]|uniref:hypothetical protein n=1 Tax=Cupriavidus metallidurans TaxID=119219 RepID=UPI003D755BE9
MIALLLQIDTVAAPKFLVNQRLAKESTFSIKGKSESLAVSGFPDGHRINLQQKDDHPNTLK